ncbi:hypothetical protein GCM10027202_02940 [Microvirgula curvata]
MRPAEYTEGANCNAGAINHARLLTKIAAPHAIASIAIRRAPRAPDTGAMMRRKHYGMSA